MCIRDRLGAYPCAIAQDSLLEKIYQKSMISERHRHRYEFNNEYRVEFEKDVYKRQLLYKRYTTSYNLFELFYSPIVIRIR